LPTGKKITEMLLTGYTLACYLTPVALHLPAAISRRKGNMIVHHVTTVQGLRGIRADGYIDPDKSKGKMMWSWFVPTVKVDWAILHVMQRHSVQLRSVRIISLDIPDHLIKEFAGSYKFYREELTPLAYANTIQPASIWVDREDLPVPGILSGLVAG